VLRQSAVSTTQGALLPIYIGNQEARTNSISCCFLGAIVSQRIPGAARSVLFSNSSFSVNHWRASPAPQVYAVIVSGTTAYVGNDSGVDEINIANPKHPVQNVRHNTGFPVRRLAHAPDGRVLAFAGLAGTYEFAPVTDPPPPLEQLNRGSGKRWKTQ
jgi:hypothetical protein